MNQLRELVTLAQETIQADYYRPRGELRAAPSLVSAISEPGATLVELEAPPRTSARVPEGGVEGLLSRLARDGASGFIVPTEPRRLLGSIANLRTAVRLGKPVLMRDLIIAEEQIDFAAHHGASAVNLIPDLLPHKRLRTLIEYCRISDRASVLEVWDAAAFGEVATSEADAILIGARDWRAGTQRREPAEAILASAETEVPVIVAVVSPAEAAACRAKGTSIAVGVNALGPKHSLSEWRPA